MRHETSARSLKAGSKFTRLKFRGLKEQAKAILYEDLETPTVLRQNPKFYEQHPEIFEEEDCYA